MGWISLSRRPQQPPILPLPEKVEAYVEHPEDISLPAPQEAEPTPQAEPAPKLQPSFLGKAYPLQHPLTPDSDLPFIDPVIVTLVEKVWKESNTSPVLERSKPTLNPSPNNPEPEPDGGIPAWIIINNIIYDCTAFQSQHPGGSVVIRNFVGQDCTWQFWRFHSQHQLVEFGRGLRVGRTRGVLNRYKEVPRFVGVSLGGDDDWGW
ncbi:cytochrome b5-like heme/steroid binding domain-containing protein [Aspergillus venezuelensis]